MEDLISASTPRILDMALEYGELAIRPHLSEAESDRMGEILTLAIHDPVLEFWIEEIDHRVGHQLGLLDEASQHDYRNQQAVLREYLELAEEYPEKVISQLKLLPKSPPQLATTLKSEAHSSCC